MGGNESKMANGMYDPYGNPVGNNGTQSPGKDGKNGERSGSGIMSKFMNFGFGTSGG